jgi:hypothetical protein
LETAYIFGGQAVTAGFYIRRQGESKLEDGHVVGTAERRGGRGESLCILRQHFVIFAVELLTAKVAKNT